MSDIKLFRVGDEAVTELESRSVALEKSLQTLIEKHMEALLGVRFLATEYSTGKAYSGRLDSLGIDENGCPVIVEYKRRSDENVINQGLFYLDWLMDHKAEFELLVIRQIGQESADGIEWSSPRLLCIAGDFNKYDEHAVQQMNRNIELIRYRSYTEGLLLLELVNAVSTDNGGGKIGGGGSKGGTGSGVTKSGLVYKTVSDYLAEADKPMLELYETLKDYLMSLGDDVSAKTLQLYIAFKRIKNFACVELRLKNKHLLVYLKVDPNSIQLEPGFSKDVSSVGHYGTGDLELTIRSVDDLEKAKPLIERSYEGS